MQPDNNYDRLLELSIKNPKKSKFDSKIDELRINRQQIF